MSDLPHLTSALRRALHVHIDALATSDTRTEQRAHLHAIVALCGSALAEPTPERADEGLMPRAVWP